MIAGWSAIRKLQPIFSVVAKSPMCLLTDADCSPPVGEGSLDFIRVTELLLDHGPFGS